MIKRLLFAVLVVVAMLAIGTAAMNVLAMQGPPPIDPAVLARVAKAPPLTIDQVNKWETELSNWASGVQTTNAAR